MGYSTDSYSSSQTAGNQQYQRQYQYTYSNPFGDDNFWEWFNSAQFRSRNQQTQNTNNYYNQYDYSNRASNEPETKRDYFSQLFLKALQTFVGFTFFRFSWIIIPFGPIICIGVIVNGISGVIKALKGLFRSSRKI